MTMNTDAIVTDHDIQSARLRVRREGIGPLMTMLRQTEPALHGYIQCAAHCMAGRMALFEQDPPLDDKDYIIRESADELLETVLVSLLALRAAQARLWRITPDLRRRNVRRGDDPPTTDTPLDLDNLPF
jgi:hypothetical protein